MNQNMSGGVFSHTQKISTLINYKSFLRIEQVAILGVYKNKKRTFVRLTLINGGSGETRTRDQRIKSPLLYRLSYRPNLAKTKIIADFLN